MGNKKKTWLIIGAIILILIIAGIVIGVVVSESKKELTPEDYENICTYYQKEAIKCAFDVSEMSLTTTEEIAEAMQTCLKDIYSDLEKDYGIKENEILPLLANHCLEIIKQDPLKYLEEINNSIPEEEEFCGNSIGGYCDSDSDCITYGCNSEICGSAGEEISSICVARECYDNEKYNLECGCVDNKCVWNNEDYAQEALWTVENTEDSETIDFCEVGVEYEHTAVNKIDCVCPEGYIFETVSTDWGPCPEEGMRDCIASVLKCVEI